MRQLDRHALFFQDVKASIDGIEVVVEHPGKPDGLIVLQFLLLVHVTNAKIVRNLEKFLFIIS